MLLKKAFLIVQEVKLNFGKNFHQTVWFVLQKFIVIYVKFFMKRKKFSNHFLRIGSLFEITDFSMDSGACEQINFIKRF